MCCFLVPDYSQPLAFKSQFSSGDFLDISLKDSKKTKKLDVGEGISSNKAEEDQTGLDAPFSCLKEGCIELYQRYSTLEHLLTGQRDTSGQSKSVVSRETEM